MEKGVRFKFTPPAETPKPGDEVKRYRYSVTAAGKDPVTGEEDADKETFVPVDPGEEGVEVSATYSLADAKGNWKPDVTVTGRVEPDKDETAPPDSAGDLKVEIG